MANENSRGAVTVAAGLLLAVCLSWLLRELIKGGVPWTPAFLCSLVLFTVCYRRPLKTEVSIDKAVFFGVLAIYLSTLRWHGGDDAPNSLLPFCLFRHGALTLDPVLDPWFTGKVEFFTVKAGAQHLSVFPPAPAILALPLYLPSILAGAPLNEPFVHNLSKISGSVITALSAVALRRSLAGRCSSAWALMLTGLYALGSWAFSVSSQALWQHGPAQLGVALGLWGLTRQGAAWDMLAGFGMGLAVASRPDSVFFLGAAGLYLLLYAPRRLVRFLIGMAVPLGLMASYWLYYTGRIRPPEISYQAPLFVGFQIKAAIGLLLSPTRGLLWFFPAAVFGIWAGFKRRDPLTGLLLTACAGPWLLLSFYSNWVGGNTYGPRYFAVAALVFCWACAGIESEVRLSRRLLGVWSFIFSISILIHALGGYLTWPGSGEVAQQKTALWFWALHPLPNILMASGALQGLAFPLRLVVAAGLLAGFAQLARKIFHRFEAGPNA